MLPTPEEFEIIYYYKEKLGISGSGGYWTKSDKNVFDGCVFFLMSSSFHIYNANKNEVMKVRGVRRYSTLEEAEASATPKLFGNPFRKKRDDLTIFNSEDSFTESEDMVTHKIKEEVQSEKKRRDYGLLKKSLKRAIIGQDKIIDEVVKKIIRMDFKLPSDAEKPLSFFWAGSTGVGKTELANQLSKLLNMPLTRIDMSEFVESHSVSRLIGSPPGYVGHGQDGVLQELTGQRVILLCDEIEKAHPNIYHLMLQALDYGKITDGKNKKIDMSKFIIVFTSNAGASEGLRRKAGFSSSELSDLFQSIQKAIHETFSPEFINRLTSMQIFNFLSEEQINLICEKNVRAVVTDIKTIYGVDLLIENEVIDRIKSDTLGNKLGARHLKRCVEKYIIEPVAEKILTIQNQDELTALSVSLSGIFEFKNNSVSN